MADETAEVQALIDASGHTQPDAQLILAELHKAGWCLMAEATTGDRELDSAISETITTLANRFDEELFALTQSELAAQWSFRWNEGASVAWNIYEFSDRLEIHKRRCRRWEDHHHGHLCVVERVRDTYLMPQIKAFIVELSARNAGRV